MYEGSLCVCCMSTEDLVQLFTSGVESDGLNYAKMLSLCLRIPVSEADGHDSICIICISKLKDCLCFKKQALKSISILSSVNLGDLVSAEELEVLELTHRGKSSLGLQQNAEAVTHSDSKAVFEENKISPCHKENTIDVDDSDTEKENRVLSSSEDRTARGAGRGGRGRRGGRVGRPRTRSPSALPYRVGPRELSCRECGQAFPNNITLKVHYNSHFGRHACEQAGCGKRFMTRASLRKHAAAHQAGPFPCDVCRQEFHKLNTLLSHKRQKHGATPPYRCGECGARFRSAGERARHLAAAHARTERRHACPYCPLTFLHSGERAKHVSRRHEVRWAVCARCGLRVRRASLPAHARRHAATHTHHTRTADKERRFACKLCGKAFGQKHTLLYHIGSHVRRGLYAGAPARLVQDRRHQPARTGLLSDEETDEQHLDESVFSDDMSDIPIPDSGAEESPCEDALREWEQLELRATGMGDQGGEGSEGVEVIEGGQRGEGSEGSGEELHHICTNLGFSTPSDFDD